MVNKLFEKSKNTKRNFNKTITLKKSYNHCKLEVVPSRTRKPIGQPHAKTSRNPTQKPHTKQQTDRTAANAILYIDKIVKNSTKR